MDDKNSLGSWSEPSFPYPPYIPYSNFLKKKRVTQVTKKSSRARDRETGKEANGTMEPMEYMEVVPRIIREGLR